MNIHSTLNPSVPVRQAAPQLSQAAPQLSQASSKVEATPPPAEPKETYESWVPLANAGVVGAVVGIPAAIGALGNSFLGPELATGLTWTALPIAAGIGVGLWAAKGAKEEFNGHPVLTAISGLVAGGAAAVASPLLATAGSAFGWTGAGVATAVGALGAGVVSAVAIHKINAKSA
jgi:hypothetical protein